MTYATHRIAPALVLVTALGACSDGLDLDLRGALGGSVDTSEAALNATADRPDPDKRGVISYPGYQVAVAKRGDTLADVASRVGLEPATLADFNGMRTDDKLRRGEIVALPQRVAEPSPATGAIGTGPIQPAAKVDVTTLASNAIDRAADTTPKTAAPQTGDEPVRHKVARGETAFTIARRYNVTPRALADWNGLDRDFSLREGQFLLIPVSNGETKKPDVSEPGSGSLTPLPPSSAQPLPQKTPPAAAAPPPPEPKVTANAPVTTPVVAAKPIKDPVVDIGQNKPAASKAPMVMPVSGSIIREYAKGRNEGIDISASAGTPVKAAASGKVASISTTAEGVKFLLIRHPGDLITVYTHLDDITVAKGDAVSRGQQIGRVRAGSPAFLHFEVRKGFESTDPLPYIQ